MPTKLIDDALLIRCYINQDRPTDSLAYSDEMSTMVLVYNQHHRTTPATEGQLYKRLVQLRKSGRLPCKTNRKPRLRKEDVVIKNLNGGLSHETV